VNVDTALNLNEINGASGVEIRDEKYIFKAVDFVWFEMLQNVLTAKALACRDEGRAGSTNASLEIDH
jgi:hypothetical protein